MCFNGKLNLQAGLDTCIWNGDNINLLLSKESWKYELY